jgi:hypothetical protein
MIKGEIERGQWKTFLDEFSKRNQLRPSRVEILGEIGAQEQEELLPFEGISFEPKGSAAGSVEIILGGETAAEPRHISHLILHAEHILPLIGIGGVEGGLEVEDGEGTKTILQFETLPELPPDTSSTSGARPS